MVDAVPQVWIAAIAVFVAVALGTVSLAMLWEWSRERSRKKEVAAQLERLATEGLDALASGAGSLFRAGEGSTPALVAWLTERVGYFGRLQARMEQAALGWTVKTFLTLVIGFALAFGLATLLVSGSLLYATIAAFLGAALPHVHVGRRRTRRLHAFEERLPEAIDLLGRAIRAGHPINSGFRMVAEEASAPVAEEFRRVFEEQRFGMAFEDSLLGMADRIPLVDVRIFVSAVLIQREVGGNLAEILDKLSYVIRQRFTFNRQLRVITAQGRLSGYVLAALPVAVGSVLVLLDPELMLPFIQSTIGKYMMAFAAVMQILGFLWIRRIVDVKM